MPVPSGISAAALPGARVTGNTPLQTLETVSFILRERKLPELKAIAEHGTRRFVTVRQFARRYGQSPLNVAQLRVYLARFGIRTRAYADRVVVVATGTAQQFDRALSVREHQYHVPGRAGPRPTDCCRSRPRSCTARPSRRCCPTGSRVTWWPYSG